MFLIRKHVFVFNLSTKVACRLARRHVVACRVEGGPSLSVIGGLGHMTLFHEDKRSMKLR